MLAIRMTVVSQQQEQEQQQQQQQQHQGQHHLNHLSYSYYPGTHGSKQTDITNTNSTQQHELRAILGHNQIAVQQRVHEDSDDERREEREQQGITSGIAGIVTEPEQVRRRAKREAGRGSQKGASRRYNNHNYQLHRGQHQRVHQRLREGAGGSLPPDSKHANECDKNATIYDGGTSDSDTSSCSAPSYSESDDTPNAAMPIGERLRYDQHSICDMFGF